MPGGASGSHPVLGGFAPNLTLTTARGTTRFAELMRGARPVLLDLTERPALREVARDWEERVDIVTARCADAPFDALLIRPDGHVVWVGEGGGNSERELRDALSNWFGSPPRALEDRRHGS